MREVVTTDELLVILNEELARNPEAAGCVFSPPIFTLAEPDEEGCNWDRSAVILSCTGEAVGRGRRIAHRVIDAVARRYNVA